MQMSLAVLAALALTGCVSTLTPTPAPPITQTIHQQTSVEGTLTIGSFMVHGIAVTYPVRVSGQGVYTLQYPATPHLIVDGDLVVEPVQGYESEVRQSLAAGRILLLRNGAKTGLAPYGTIQE